MGIGDSLMITAHDIREKVLAYLAGSLDLDGFEDWIAQSTWNIHQWGTSEAQNLAYTVELRLSEYSSGHLTDLDLRESLARTVLASLEGRYGTFSSSSSQGPESETASPVTEADLQLDFQAA